MPARATRSTPPASALPYDALLLCSFGGPNREADVLPFLRNVTAGRGVPDERLAVVAEHYLQRGGRSPINELNLALRTALEGELRARGIGLPVLWGNRNWHPYTVDTLRDAQAFGARRILTLVTSAYASYSSSRQYREHLAAARAELGGSPLEVDVIRPFFNDPGFLTANLEHILQAAATLPGSDDPLHIAYVTHSIPDAMEHASARTGPSYTAQHEDVRATLDADLRARLGTPVTSSLSFCSRSGSPRVPWQEPDISDRLRALAAAGERRVVIAPIGFVSDHMEVVHDLDIEAMETAAAVGIDAARAGTAGTHPAFVAGLVDLVCERAARERGQNAPPSVRGNLAAFPDHAPADSCRARADEVTGIPVLAGTLD